MNKKVAVIGAGAAGLCALRHLTREPSMFDVMAFERYGCVGGLWVYTDRVGTDTDGLPVHSSMYRDLRTNLPKDVMMFPDFPFENPLPSYTSHREVLEYLESYAEHFNLKRHIKFNTLVTRVEPTTPGDRDTKWEVTFAEVVDLDTTTTMQFDAVLVCNGHYSVPYEPDIPGTDTFRGTILHAHDYRAADGYQGKTVVVLGSGLSAMDLYVELASTAKTVYFSHNPFPFDLVLPASVADRPGIHHLTEDRVVFANGDQAAVDVVLLCTGYKYRFPFLSEKCGLVLEDNSKRVTPLFKHMIHTTYPTMAFIGIPFHGTSFPMFDLQVRFFEKFLAGSLTLPSKAIMDRDTAEELEQRLASGKPSRDFHSLLGRHFKYIDSLCDLAGLTKMPVSIRVLFAEAERSALADFQTYKERNYELVENTVKVIDG